MTVAPGHLADPPDSEGVADALAWTGMQERVQMDPSMRPLFPGSASLRSPTRAHERIESALEAHELRRLRHFPVRPRPRGPVEDDRPGRREAYRQLGCRPTRPSRRVENVLNVT
jgi:hypothetical protein